MSHSHRPPLGTRRDSACCRSLTRTPHGSVATFFGQSGSDAAWRRLAAVLCSSHEGCLWFDSHHAKQSPTVMPCSALGVRRRVFFFRPRDRTGTGETRAASLPRPVNGEPFRRRYVHTADYDGRSLRIASRGSRSLETSLPKSDGKWHLARSSRGRRCNPLLRSRTWRRRVGLHY